MHNENSLLIPQRDRAAAAKHMWARWNSAQEEDIQGTMIIPALNVISANIHCDVRKGEIVTGL